MCFSKNAVQKLKNASLLARVAGIEGRERFEFKYSGPLEKKLYYVTSRPQSADRKRC